MVGPGKLTIIPTPLGDPEDITLRALRVLREVDVVAAEDTRVARELLRHHGLPSGGPGGVPLVSYHDHNESERVPALLERMRRGEHVGLLSDAGTPLINDPGWRIVRACLDAGIPIEVLPGPCAAITALVGSGLAVDRFCFGGFLPRDPGPRVAALRELADVPATLIFYESPLRLAATLEAVAALWPGRPVCAARNLTKEHEQWLRGTAAEVRAELGDETRGEVVLLIGRPTEASVADDATIDAEIDALLAEGLGARASSDRLAEATGLPRREAYARILKRIRG